MGPRTDWALLARFSRYYVLIAACVFARKSDWLRNACLAGALLFPAVAALHGIVLAAVHVNGEAIWSWKRVTAVELILFLILIPILIPILTYCVQAL